MHIDILSLGLTGGVSAGVLAQAITGNTPVSLQAAIASAVFVCGLVWWLGRKFKSIETKLKNHSTMLRVLCEKNEINPQFIELDDEESR